MSDSDYLAVLETTLDQALTISRPQLVIYDAGVDIHRADPLGRLNISSAGILERDRHVLACCRDAGLPVATVIGGGYDDDRDALAERHALVIEAARSVFARL